MNKLYIFLISAVFVSGMALLLPAHAEEPSIVGNPTFEQHSGVLTITFDGDVDVSRILPFFIRIRDSGDDLDFSLSSGELRTTEDGTTIQFALAEHKRKLVIGMSAPTLEFRTHAFYDTAGNIITPVTGLPITSVINPTGPAILDRPTFEE